MKTNNSIIPEAMAVGDAIVYKGYVSDVIAVPLWGHAGAPKQWQTVRIKTREHGNVCLVDSYDLAHFCSLA